jgi:hypothetical protein
MRRSAMFGVMFLAAMLTVAAPAQASPACTWSWTDLPVPPSLAASVEIKGSDGRGTYVGTGWNYVTQQYEAVLWRNGSVRLLGAAFGDDTTAWDVNANGVVVGDTVVGPVRYRAGQWEYLPMPTGYGSGIAMHVNDNGDVAGVVGVTRAILWPASGSHEFLDVPAITDYREPTGLASDGTVTVWAQMASEPVSSSFFRARNGTWTRVTHPNPNESALIVAVNDDIAVGNAGQAAVEWDHAGAVVRTYPGVTAVDVNGGGQVLAHELGEVTIWRGGVREARLPATANGLAIKGGVAIDEDGAVVGHRESADWSEWARPVVARCA